MDRRALQPCSVESVKPIANPIHMARLMMEKTPHVLLVADGAEEFAKSQGATPFNTTGRLASAVLSDGSIRMSGWSKTATPLTVPAQ
jgi:isoaspartyl peptidase/L-asparaginase-like protein (Ntn-hydrolase superfamily)